MKLWTRTTAGALALVFTASGCSSLNNTQKGAIIGAGGGAAVGAIAGAKLGSTAKGAIVGAAVGGVAGAAIGARMDKQAKELAMDIEGARVERVGEGIAVTFDSGLLFDYNSDVVKGASRENLISLANSLKKYNDTDLMIVGHTDDIGSDSFNQGLSERRARAARSFLMSQGIPSDRIRIAGRGEGEPIAENASDAGRSQNRRVEVAIFASEELRRSVSN